ncbi:Oidioi.mRNA.OKI2018_I69.PAR.g11568.t1.cds [Oikopleura dioica]|uniref:Complex I intermediate-associated protein 30, mitochondrial n=1 Tax=Oikopleura dioica TaxID=34765 RepID=A0ABN7RZ95_OIKDI|nr:Oidioi.mRNA.OKI2018_I69.PAR.g11568.t1.cds [Oikopleura dioica]
MQRVTDVFRAIRNSVKYGGQKTKEQKHFEKSLPPEELGAYIKYQKAERAKQSGFDWNSVGFSMLYNRERGSLAWAKNNIDPSGKTKAKFVNQKLFSETAARRERILYTFRDINDLEWWDMMTDENIEGFSKCKMTMNETGTGVMWYGHLDTRVPDIDWGRLSMWKSFAMLYTKTWERDYGRPDKLNLIEYNCFEFRIRGDGRRYEFDVHGNRVFEQSTSMWSTPIHTKGGYEWETIRVPFYHFYQQHKDAKVRDQTYLAVEGIWGFRFRLQDDVPGPFKLEIDYVGVAYDFEFKTFSNDHYEQVMEQMLGTQEKFYTNTQSIQNHFFHDPYRATLRRTTNVNNDTTATRQETLYGGHGTLH